jgi:peptidase M28-like protein
MCERPNATRRRKLETWRGTVRPIQGYIVAGFTLLHDVRHRADRTRLHLIRYLFGSLLLVCFANSASGQDSKVTISTEDETAQDIAHVPCHQSERLAAVRGLFIKMGAQAGDVLIERRDGVANLVVRKPGKSQGILVIGAHYNKSREGCGAIDNWTGIVALAHMYKSLRDAPLQKTLIFVAFGKGELGEIDLRAFGSRAMVNKIKKEEVNQYCAMINIDAVGMAAPQVQENVSSKTLTTRVGEIAQRMKLPFNKLNIWGMFADSLPFIERKIPAVTISALGNGWADLIHTRHDQVGKVNTTSLYLGYRLALALVTELDNLACGVSREESKAN